MKDMRDLSSEVSWSDGEEMEGARLGKSIKAIEMYIVKFSTEFAQRAFAKQGFL